MLNLFEKFEIAVLHWLLIAFVAILLDRLGDDARTQVAVGWLQNRRWSPRQNGVTSVFVSPAYACFPVPISYSTKPRENKSVRASTFSPRNCSGDV